MVLLTTGDVSTKAVCSGGSHNSMKGRVSKLGTLILASEFYLSRSFIHTAKTTSIRAVGGKCIKKIHEN